MLNAGLPLTLNIKTGHLKTIDIYPIWTLGR